MRLVYPSPEAAKLTVTFAPLGYEVRAEETALLDEQFPEWGNSPYIKLSIRGKVRLRDLLNHIYVLIPVFDRQKHYWIGEDEVDKLLSHGKGWLEEHPEKTLIARRYFKNLRTLARSALDRLDNGEGAAGEFPVEETPLDEGGLIFPIGESGGGADSVAGGEDGIADALTITDTAGEDEPMNAVVNIDAADNDADEPAKIPRPRLNTQRLLAVFKAIKESGAQSVIDLGCGEGNLLRLLMKDKTFTRVTGVDVSRLALEHARDKLKIDRLSEARQKRVSLLQGSVTYRDKRFRGYDAAALVEVIEHLDENRIDTLAALILGDARPGILVITTPNIEYNPIYGMSRFRHGDHRFEWNRDQFQSRARELAQRYGYDVSFEAIGEADEQLGAPTQMAVFVRGEIPGPGSLPCA